MRAKLKTPIAHGINLRRLRMAWVECHGARRRSDCLDAVRAVGMTVAVTVAMTVAMTVCRCFDSMPQVAMAGDVGVPIINLPEQGDSTSDVAGHSPLA